MCSCWIISRHVLFDCALPFFINQRIQTDVFFTRDIMSPMFRCGCGANGNISGSSGVVDVRHGPSHARGAGSSPSGRPEQAASFGLPPDGRGKVCMFFFAVYRVGEHLLLNSKEACFFLDATHHKVGVGHLHPSSTPTVCRLLHELHTDCR